MIKAGDISSSSYVEISPYCGTKAAMDQLVSEGFLVVREKEQFKGIITIKDYINNPHNLIIDCIVSKPEIKFGDDLSHALRVLKDSKQPALPIFKDDEFHGVFSTEAAFQFVSEKLLKEFPDSLGDEAIMATRTLVAGLGHDFLNLLNIIIGGITVALRYKIDNEELIANLQMIERASLAAKKLSRQLLSFARTEAPEREIYDLVKLISESISFYTVNSGITPEFDFGSDVLPVAVNVDQINQVFSNITVNAIQAMPEGGKLSIRLRRIHVDESTELPLQAGEYACLEFKDTGVGIARKYLQKIFDPSFTLKPKGTGLGLSIAYGIISKHNGHIDVESEPDKGTTFTIYLPVTDGSHIQEMKRESDFTKIEETSELKKVLIMDDNQDIINLTLEYLSHLGHRVMAATSFEKTIKIYKEALDAGEPFDIVLLDLILPGDAGGEKVMRALLDIDPDARGIVTSGHPDHEIMKEFQNYGFSGAITKPFSLGDLKAILEN